MVSTEAEPAQASEPSFSFGLRSADVLPVLIAVAAVASAISGQQPTGNIAADVVLSFGFGAVVVWLSRWASPQSLVVSAVLALFFTGLQLPAALIGLAAVASALFLTVWRPFDSESWLIGAAVTAAFTGQTVLNLPNVGFVGSASLLAVVALAPMIVTAAQRLPAKHRRQAVLVGAAIAVYSVIASGMAIAAALGVRDHVEVGITQAENGITAVEFGDQPTAIALLEAAEANFNRAGDRLGGPLTWPARFVPIVAQHSRAIETAADQGAALARTAGRVVERANVDRIRGANGAIDVAVVEEVNVELTSANVTMRAAQQTLLDVQTPWLLPILSSRLESVQSELVSTSEDIDLANHATSVLPGILGADEPRQYLVLFVQPAESREFGGFVGAYGLLIVDGGRFDLRESGSIDVDFGYGEGRFENPGDFPNSYLRTAPDINPQNLTAIADLSTIAAAASELSPQWREDESFAIDGVITIDPYALGGLLELTGPVSIEGRIEPIDANNVANFLLREQYAQFERNDREARQDLLQTLASVAFDRLVTVEVPGPERLGAIFGPLVRANRLSFVTNDDAENAFLDRVFLSADLPRVAPTTDMLGIYTATATASKLDAYTTRSTTYVVDIDPRTGEYTGQVTVEITNGAPADAGGYVLGDPEESFANSGELVAPGTNIMALSVYSHEGVTDYDSSAPWIFVEESPALGYLRNWTVIEAPLGETSTVTFNTRGRAEPGRYDLVTPPAMSALPGEFTLIVRPKLGWSVAGVASGVDGSWSVTADTEAGNGFAVTFELTG